MAMAVLQQGGKVKWPPALISLQGGWWYDPTLSQLCHQRIGDRRAGLEGEGGAVIPSGNPIDATGLKQCGAIAKAAEWDVVITAEQGMAN